MYISLCYSLCLKKYNIFSPTYLHPRNRDQQLERILPYVYTHKSRQIPLHCFYSPLMCVQSKSLTFTYLFPLFLTGLGLRRSERSSVSLIRQIPFSKFAIKMLNSFSKLFLPLSPFRPEGHMLCMETSYSMLNSQQYPSNLVWKAGFLFMASSLQGRKCGIYGVTHGQWVWLEGGRLAGSIRTD